MTDPSSTDGGVRALDVKAERRRFEVWWQTWCPDSVMPSIASHTFDAWLARARLSHPKPEAPQQEEVERETIAAIYNDLRPSDNYLPFPGPDDDGGFDGSDEKLAEMIVYSGSVDDPVSDVLFGIKLGRALRPSPSSDDAGLLEAVQALVQWARDNQARPLGNPGGEGWGHIDENHRFILRDLVEQIDLAALKSPAPAQPDDGGTEWPSPHEAVLQAMWATEGEGEDGAIMGTHPRRGEFERLAHAALRALSTSASPEVSDGKCRIGSCQRHGRCVYSPCRHVALDKREAGE